MNATQIPGQLHTDIKGMFRETIKITRFEPGKLLFFLRLLLRQRSAFRRRQAAMSRGEPVKG